MNGPLLVGIGMNNALLMAHYICISMLFLLIVEAKYQLRSVLMIWYLDMTTIKRIRIPLKDLYTIFT